MTERYIYIYIYKLGRIGRGVKNSRPLSTEVLGEAWGPVYPWTCPPLIHIYYYNDKIVKLLIQAKSKEKIQAFCYFYLLKISFFYWTLYFFWVEFYFFLIKNIVPVAWAIILYGMAIGHKWITLFINRLSNELILYL